MALTRTRDPETSHEAAAAASIARHNHRRLVLAAIRCRGPCSAKALEHHLHWISPESIRGSIKWLRNWGYIRLAGYVRLRSGRRARAWKAAS